MNRLNITEEKMSELKYIAIRLYEINHRMKNNSKKEKSINQLWKTQLAFYIDNWSLGREK